MRDFSAERAAQAGAGATWALYLAGRLSGLGGWRRYLLALVLGALAALALPPFHLLPLLIPAFVGLLWMLDGTEGRWAAFRLGWTFGFGHFVLGVYWVGIAFLVDAPRFAAIMPLMIAGLAAWLALFPAAAAMATQWLAWRGPARIFAFSIFWLLGEWLRGWLFTGFPWNLLGWAWGFSDWMLQSASVVGAWGLTLLALLPAALPAVLGDPATTNRRRALALGCAVALPLGALAAGALRLSDLPPPGAETEPGLRLRIVQPSTPQDEKWAQELRLAHLRRLVDLTRRPGPQPITHVIWPETAVPFFLNEDEGLRRELASLMPAGSQLITGAPSVDRNGEEARVANSVLALAADGAVIARFDKFHLVPFGEYVPLRWLFGDLKLTEGRGDFTPGEGPQNLDLPGLPAFSPLVCYEVIFPGEVLAPGAARPQWLLNLTNDAWFGRSSGPYQHYVAARLRAVEEGLPLVRAANNGISAVVDSYGREVAALPLDEIGVLDAGLPLPSRARTPFSHLGNWVLVLLIAAGALAAILCRDRITP